MSVHMEQYESAPLFKADNATLSFYSAKDGKISVSYQGWDASKTVLEWQQFVLGTAGGRGAHRVQGKSALPIAEIRRPVSRVEADS